MGRYAIDMCIPIAYDVLPPRKIIIKLRYYGRLTWEGKARPELPEGSVLRYRRRQAGVRGGSSGSDTHVHGAVLILAKMAQRLLVGYSKAVTREISPRVEAVLWVAAIGGCSRAITCAWPFLYCETIREWSLAVLVRQIGVDVGPFEQ